MARSALSVPAEDQHLLPAFDANTQTVAALRGLLLEHDVEFPGNAKKADLVRLFNAQVKPRAAEILRSRQGVVASGKGIERIRSVNNEESATSAAVARRGSKKRPAALADLSESSSDEDEPAPVVVKRGRPKAAIIPAPTPSRRLQLEPESSSEEDEPLKVPAKRAFRESPDHEQQQKTVALKREDAKVSPERKKARKTYHGEALDNTIPAATPAKRRKSDFPAIRDSPNDSGFSDFNPFQDGNDDTPDKKPAKKRKSSIMPPPIQREEYPEYTEMDIDPPQIESPPRRMSASKSMGHLSVPDAIPRASSPLNPKRLIEAKEPPQSIRKVRSTPRFEKHMETDALQWTPARLKELQQVEKTDRRSSAPQPRLDLDRAPTTRKRVSLGPTQIIPTKQESPEKSTFPAKSALSKRLVVTRPRQEVSLLSNSAKKATWLTMAFTLLCYSVWWRHERLSVGYCDTGSNTNSRMSHNTPLGISAVPGSVDSVPSTSAATLALSRISAVDIIRPLCMSCPTHGICVDGKLLACEKDYLEQPNFWTKVSGGIIPAPKHCRPDTERLTRIAELASTTLQKLQKHKGQSICHGPTHKKGSSATDDLHKYGVDSDLLALQLRPQFQDRIPENAWEDYFASAIRELVEDGQEAQLGEEADGRQIVAAINAEYPLSCRARMKTYEFAAKRKTEIGQLLAVIISILWAQSTFSQYRSERKRVTELANTAFRLLQEQKYRHKMNAAIEPYFGVMRMRDQLLATEHALSVRKRVWQKVTRIVESNDNVRQQEVDHEGQPLRAWEWSGNLSLSVEDGTPTKRARFEGDSPKIGSIYPDVSL